MKLADIVNGPWAVTPEMLTEIQGIYRTHLKGDKIDLEAVEARLGQPLNNEPKAYEIEDGVAVITLDGVIGKRMNLMTRISGGVSTDLARRDLADAVADPEVDAILLDIDSPGGTVEGTPDLYNDILAARKELPIIAWSDGTIASAAYWIASACDKIFIANDAAVVGSIGVVAGHRDISGAEAQAGIKTTEITAGRYKRIASSYAPLDSAGRADIQSRLDYIYAYFVDSVAAGRGVSSATVLEKMADGRIFIGRQNLDHGLVDGVATKAELIKRINAGEFATRPQPAAGAAVAKNGDFAMTIDELKKDHAELIDQIEAAAVAEKLPAAVAGEQTRILDLHQAVFGTAEGQKFATIVKAGIDADQATSLLAALTPTPVPAKKSAGAADDAESRAKILTALENSGPEDVTGSVPVPKVEDEDPAKAFAAKVKDYRTENKCGLGTATTAIAREYPELHEAWLAEQK